MSRTIKKLTERIWPFLLAGGVATLLLGFVSIPTEIYYTILIISFIYSLTRTNYISYRWAFLVAVLAFNCFISDAPPIFKIWERLFLFILILGTATPLLGSRTMLHIRCITLKYLLFVFCTIGSISFFCYFAGINMMTKFRVWGDAHSLHDAGWFSGITRHSMILAPICAFAAVYLLFLLLNKSYTRKKRTYIIILLITIVTTMLMAASRSAFLAFFAGSLIVLYLTFHNRIKKLFKAILAIVFAVIALYPLLAPQFDKILSKQHNSTLSSGGMTSSRNAIWEQRISEFNKSPVFGIGFCTIEISHEEVVTTENGTIEPGSSWLAVLSMTGLSGMAAILLIIIPTLTRLYAKSINRNYHSILLLGLLITIIVHMFAEGYIFSGGNPLCFYFWILLGVSYQISKENTPKSDDNILRQY